jgi:hypothetical protein
MVRTSKPQIYILLLLSIACMSLGGLALRAEAGAAALGAGGSSLPQFLSMMDEDMPLPFSVPGRRTLLEHCQMVLQDSAPLALRFASDEQRAMAEPFCLDLAQQSVDVAQTDAYAWLVLASAQLKAGQVEEASKSIVWSARTGPNEGWIAQSRFDLVQDHYEDLSPSAQAVGDADTALLVPGNGGSVVARRYLMDDAFRGRAESLVEEQSEAVQSRFVALVRRQLQGAVR